MERVNNLQVIRKKLFDIKPSKKLSRNLFGEVNHEETMNELKNEYNLNVMQKSKLWNFDFENFSPFPNKNNDKELEWTKVSYGTKQTECTSNNTNNLNNSSIQSKSSTASNKTSTSIDKDDDSRVIRIVNASPPRPKIHPKDLNRYKNNDEVFMPYSGKRKRAIQPKIDDFMKKKKRRLSMDLPTSCKSYTKVSSPIARRLRSLTSQVSV